MFFLFSGSDFFSGIKTMWRELGLLAQQTTLLQAVRF